MGSKREELTVVYDTGSSWLVIADEECDKSCKGLVYASSESTDFVESDKPIRPQVYGSSYLEGYEVHDSVCVADDPSACIKKFEWFNVLYEEGMDGIHGICGMSTGFADWSGPILVNSLYEGGIISEPVFGWFMSDQTGTTFMDIGMLSYDSIREGDELIWMDVLDDDFWWTNEITGVSLNGNQFKVPKKLAMTDTGTSCVSAPKKIFSTLFDNIFKDVTPDVDQWGYVNVDPKDVEKLPTIELLMGGYWLEMLPEDYMIWDSGTKTFWMCIDESSDEMWVLGDAFLRGYYSTHDHAEKRFGFAPHSLSTKKSPYKGEVPVEDLQVQMETWVIILVAVGAVLVVVAIVLLIVFLVPGILPTSTAAKVEITEASELLSNLSEHELVKTRLTIHSN